jgi:uncharacterized protein YhfF
VEIWDAYRAANGVTVELAGAFAFGDSPEMADELVGLVLHGPKRATAGLLLDYEHDGEKLPEPGDYWVIRDGRGDGVGVIQDTHVEIKPLREADDAFAWDEGEGDRTLAWWRRAHDAFFTRQCQQLGVPFTDDLLVVFERFDLVWPRPTA